MTLAPIAFFAYKRPEHTLRALEALSRCELAGESRLFIFCDGPKKLEDREMVEKVREIAASRQWCGAVEVIAKKENAGLANSVITGVTELCSKYGKIIVLEDDLVVSPVFLRYMNDALELYKDEEQVMQISGHMFDAALVGDTDAIFLDFVTSWGWGTWARAWRQFDAQLSGFEKLRLDGKLRNRFNLDGNYPYFKILEKQIAGDIDSWAIAWNLTVFMRGGLVLYPVNSMVYNGGFDGSGTHCGKTEQRMGSFIEKNGQSFRFPRSIEVSPAKQAVYRAIHESNKTTFAMKLKKLKKMIFKLPLSH